MFTEQPTLPSVSVGCTCRLEDISSGSSVYKLKVSHSLFGPLDTVDGNNVSYDLKKNFLLLKYLELVYLQYTRVIS